MIHKKSLMFVSCLIVVALLSPLLLLGQTGRSEKKASSSNKNSNSNKKSESTKKSGSTTKESTNKKGSGSSSSSSSNAKGATAEEIEYWNSIKESEDPTDFEAYLESYPKGFYAGQAKAKLAAIKRNQEIENWNSIKNSKDPKDFEDFLEAYPNGSYAKQAKVKLDAINREETEKWNSIKDGKDPKVFEDFLRDYPKGAHAGLAKARLDTIKDTPPTTPATTPEGRKPKFRNIAGIEFVYIPPGEFFMGSSDEEIKVVLEDAKRENPKTDPNQFNDEKPRHRVTINYFFYMGKYEVTQEQWFKVTGTAPSSNRDCDDCPVEQVSWDDVKEFIKKLNEQDSNYVYRLPTEAEWEYACRAGTTTFFAFGNSLSSQQANFNGDYPFGTDEKGLNNKETVGVGNYQANNFGLFNMHGNVFEWCEDVYTNSYEDLPKDGSANTIKGDANIKVMRGGSYNLVGRNLRSADRSKNFAGTRLQFIGFRLVAIPKTP